MYETPLALKLQVLFTTPATPLLLIYAAGLWLMVRDRGLLGEVGRMAIVGYACLVAGTIAGFASRFLQMQVPRKLVSGRITLDQDAAGFAIAVGIAGAIVGIAGAIALLLALLKARRRAGAV